METEKPRRIIRLVIKKPSMPPELTIIKHTTDAQTKRRKLPKQSDAEVENAEIKAMFDKIKTRKKMADPNPAGIGLLVEEVMALMEVAAEEDVELNTLNQPAIKKIQMLPLLIDFLSKKHLQPEFLGRGVLSLFKTWLEPLPDGSLPNVTVRASILNILTHILPVDISSEHRREQLKRSGLGKVIMFLSKSEEEITSNRQHAKDLIDNWSRTIFNKSTRYSDLRYAAEKVVIPMNKASAMQLREVDLDLELRPKKPCLSRSGGVSVPEAAPCVYAVIPRTKSKADAEVERTRLRCIAQRDNKTYKKIEKGIRRMKNSNKKTVYKSFSACKAPIC